MVNGLEVEFTTSYKILFFGFISSEFILKIKRKSNKIRVIFLLFFKFFYIIKSKVKKKVSISIYSTNIYDLLFLQNNKYFKLLFLFYFYCYFIIFLIIYTKNIHFTKRKVKLEIKLKN